MRRLTAVVSFALALTACGGDGTSDPDGDPGTSTSDAPVTTTTTSSAPDDPSTTTSPPVVGRPQTEAFTSDGYPANGTPGFLTAVRTETYDPFARLVFEFDGPVPEFALEYVDRPIVQSPSGQPVDIVGDVMLTVSMTPATGVDLSGDEPVETYTGPERLEIDAEVVNELVQTEDFESHMTWVVGLDEVVPFSFSTLEDPARFVVDIHTSDS